MWFNQIPVASGLINDVKGSRALDLVCRKASGKYDFIEPKYPRSPAKMETPLSAAIQILKYGLIYLYIIKYPETLTKARGWPHKGELPLRTEAVDAEEFLKAADVDLCVLAPRWFYSRFELEWMETELARGLTQHVEDERVGKLKRMTFRFEYLNDDVLRVTEGNGFTFDFTRRRIGSGRWAALASSDRET